MDTIYTDENSGKVRNENFSACGAEKSTRRQELFRAGHKLASRIVFQHETRQAAKRAAYSLLDGLSVMKKCANCGFESPDEAISCPSCSTDAFVSSSPEALGHIISPEEQRFWERMTFRQFAIFLIRLQALWLIFYAVVDATYLLEYLTPYIHFTHYAYMIVFRVALHLALAVICIRYPDRIVSWFVKDVIPKTPPVSDDDKPAA